MRYRLAIARVAAPLAFLLLATLGVVAVRSALDDSASAPTVTATATAETKPAGHATTATTKGKAKTTTTANAAQGRYYVVQAGDTLGTIATQSGTTVENLLQLNPGIDPNALRIGQRVRVG